MTNDCATAAAAPRRAVAYLRVSLQQQADRGDLGVQHDKVYRWAHNNGYQIVQTVQEVQRGTLTSSEERPALHECLMIAKKDNLVIITLSPSRISRNAEHAKKLDLKHPGRFVFVEQEHGYGDRPWSDEVVDIHAPLPATIANGTTVALDALQRKGVTLGAPDGGKAGRAVSAAVRSAKAQSLAEGIADFLESDPARHDMTRQELIPPLTAAGIRTTRGEAFNPDRLRRPLRAAKAVLLTRAAAKQTSAPHGPLRGAGEVFGGSQGHAASTLKSAPISMPLSDIDLKKNKDLQSVQTAAPAVQDIAQAYSPSTDFRGLSQQEIDDAEVKKNPIWGMFG